MKAFGTMLLLGLGWLPPANPSECSALLQTSESYYQQGAYGPAEDWLRRALACQETLLPLRHPDLAATYDRLGELARLRKEFRKAEDFLKAAMSIWSDNPEVYSADVAEAHNGLAMVYYDQHRYREAEAQAREAMAMSENSQGPASFGVASALHTLGYLFGALEDFVTAERNFRLALECQKKGNRRDILTTSLLHNLGTARYELGFPAEAEELYRESLALQIELLPPNHPNIVATRKAYAKVLKRKSVKQKTAD